MSVRRVYGAEWYRLVRSRTAWACGTFLALLSFLRVFAEHVAERSSYATALQRALASGRAAPPVPEPGNAYGPFVDGWSAGLTVGTLVLLIYAARGIAADLESGVLRASLTRSASRGATLCGRALLGVPLCLFTVLVTALGAWLGAAWLFEFGPLIEDGYELMSTAELHEELLGACMTTLPPMLATWTFGLLVSALCRTGAGAVAGALVTYLGFDLFKEVLGDDRWWVFAAFNPSLVDNSYIKEVASMARGFSDAGFTQDVFRMNLIVPWPEGALLVLLAWGVLSRRSLS